MMDGQQELYLIADELRGMANIARRFSESVYDAERADHMLELAARVAALAGEHPVEETRAMFLSEPWLRMSPAIGVEAVVFNADGELLLTRRRDNGHWVVPGGVAEIGQTPAEAALRELWEEAGLRGEVTRLLGLFDGRLWGTHSTVHLVHVAFLVECRELEPSPGVEMTAAGFFAEDGLPSPLQAGHDQRIPRVFELARNGGCHVDLASAAQMDLPMHQRP